MLVLSGREAGAQPEEAAPVQTLAEEMESLLAAGLSEKEAMKQVARNRNLGKREVYRQWLLAKAGEMITAAFGSSEEAAGNDADPMTAAAGTGSAV